MDVVLWIIAGLSLIGGTFLALDEARVIWFASGVISFAPGTAGVASGACENCHEITEVTLPEGLRVLRCYTVSARYHSPDKKNNPLLGIVFRSKEKKDAYTRMFLFFNQDDLTLIY